MKQRSLYFNKNFDKNIMKFSTMGSLNTYDWKKAAYTLGKLVIATVLTFVQTQVLSVTFPDVTIIGIFVQGVAIQQAINYILVYVINRWFRDYTQK